MASLSRPLPSFSFSRSFPNSFPTTSCRRGTAFSKPLSSSFRNGAHSTGRLHSKNCSNSGVLFTNALSLLIGSKRREARLIKGRGRWRSAGSGDGVTSVQLEEDGEAAIEECEVVLGKEVVLGEGEDAYRVHLVQPVKNSNGSGVLLLTDILGFANADTRDFAYRLACFGYSVLIPDLFRDAPWEEGRSKEEYEGWRDSHPPERIASDVETASKYLVNSVLSEKSLPGKGRIALLGFCFGGGRVIEALARDGDSGAERWYSTGLFFYGTRFDVSLAKKIRVPLLLVAGDSDELCSTSAVNAVAKEVTGSVVKIYANRGHGFVHRPTSIDEDEDAEDAFELTRNWLHDQLLEKAPGPWVDGLVDPKSGK